MDAGRRPAGRLPWYDRGEAGRDLAVLLSGLHPPLPDPVVLALPRGGLPVAEPVAAALGAPLDVVVVGKVGLPGHSEVALGAVGAGQVTVHDATLARSMGLTPDDVTRLTEAVRTAVRRRHDRYRALRAPEPLEGRTAVLVDDGLATGATMIAAIREARARGAETVVVAAPVGAPEAVERVREEAERVVCPVVPRGFRAVGDWYVRFAPVPDGEARALLARAAGGRPDPASG